LHGVTPAQSHQIDRLKTNGAFELQFRTILGMLTLQDTPLGGGPVQAGNVNRSGYGQDR
jgi:hypothetical protein